MALTLDVVLQALVRTKSENAAVVLADGTAIGEAAIPWKDIKGILMHGLAEVRNARLAPPDALALAGAGLVAPGGQTAPE